MRRSASLLTVVCLIVTGAAPFSGDRLVCPMPMTSPAASSCEACGTDSPEAPSSLEAASCCSVAPASVAESVPATVSATRRGAGSGVPDAVPLLAAIEECPEFSTHVQAFDASAPSPAAPPPLILIETTHLRN